MSGIQLATNMNKMNYEIIKETQFGIVINFKEYAKCSECMFANKCTPELEKSHDYGHRYMNFQELKEYYASKIQELEIQNKKLTSENEILITKAEAFENYISEMKVHAHFNMEIDNSIMHFISNYGKAIPVHNYPSGGVISVNDNEFIVGGESVINPLLETKERGVVIIGANDTMPKTINQIMEEDQFIELHQRHISEAINISEMNYSDEKTYNRPFYHGVYDKGGKRRNQRH